MSRLVTAALLGQLVGLAGWIDPIFIPFVLAAPLVTGAIAAARGIEASWIATLWGSAGICMLWTDWVVNGEDVVFHAVSAVVMALIALAGWGVVRLVVRRSNGRVGASA
ncbi:hypothetical protein [Nocardia salmonicida]|uniref:hypothetical protein n=1 Tax=Nocardia salmonicida TaxID=53431 RepID=UPI0033E98B3F